MSVTLYFWQHDNFKGFEVNFQRIMKNFFIRGRLEILTRLRELQRMRVSTKIHAFVDQKFCHISQFLLQTTCVSYPP